MAWDALVIGERGEGVFRPVLSALEVDEINGRTRAIERGLPVIAVGRPVLNLGRNSADLERLLGKRRERTRELGGHRLHSGIQIGDQLLAAGVGVWIKLVRRLVQRGQALADAA